MALSDNFYNRYDTEDKLKQLDFIKIHEDEQNYYAFKFDENDFFDYYFWIEIKPSHLWESFIISWDIMYWHTSENGNVNYWEKFYLTSVFRDYPQYINQNIKDFIDRFPFSFDRSELNYDDLIYMKNELTNIVKYLNKKRMSIYYITNHLYKTNLNPYDE